MDYIINITTADKTKITNLIKSNLTEIDKIANAHPLRTCPYGDQCRRLKNPTHIKEESHPMFDEIEEKEINAAPEPTSYDVAKTKVNFTDTFLEYINEILEPLKDDDVKNYGNKQRDTMAYIISGLFVPLNKPSSFLTRDFPTGNISYPNATYYSPVNRLYFLFLVNLYCNYKIYHKKYDWLETFLFLCDQIGLTGIFAINEKLYMELCGKCDKNSRGGYEIGNGHFLLSNSSIKVNFEAMTDTEQKTQRDRMSTFMTTARRMQTKTDKAFKSKKTRHNTLSKSVVAAAAASAAATVREPCIHGVNCFRTKNTAHTSKFSHPLPKTVVEEEDDDEMSHAGGAKRKTHKNKKTHKTKKTYKNKKTNKKKKHTKRK